jgi:hypothetical protein
MIEADGRLTEVGSVVEYTGGSTAYRSLSHVRGKGLPLHIVTSNASGCGATVSLCVKRRTKTARSVKCPEGLKSLFDECSA